MLYSFIQRNGVTMLLSKKRWLCSLLSNVVIMYKWISFYLRLHWQQ